jgi:hypothetical protein
VAGPVAHAEIVEPLGGDFLAGRLEQFGQINIRMAWPTSSFAAISKGRSRKAVS